MKDKKLESCWASLMISLPVYPHTCQILPGNRLPAPSFKMISFFYFLAKLISWYKRLWDGSGQSNKLRMNFILIKYLHSSEPPKAWQSIFHALLPHRRTLVSMLWRERTVKAEVNSLQVWPSLPLCVSISMTHYIGQCDMTQSRQEGEGVFL